MAVAVLSALLIREPTREFPTTNDSGAAAVAKGDAGGGGGGGAQKGNGAENVATAVVEGGGAGEESEERESFREALSIVFQSNTVKLVSLISRSLCAWVLHVVEAFGRGGLGPQRTTLFRVVGIGTLPSVTHSSHTSKASLV